MTWLSVCHPEQEPALSEVEGAHARVEGPLLCRHTDTAKRPFRKQPAASLGLFAALALATGAAAVVSLSWGCTLMVRETSLAIHNPVEEAKIGSRPAS